LIREGNLVASMIVLIFNLYGIHDQMSSDTHMPKRVCDSVVPLSPLNWNTLLTHTHTHTHC